MDVAQVSVPGPDEVIADIRSYDDLIEAFRAIKERLNLSNRECDDLGGMVQGHVDKVLGPTRVKNIGPHVFGVLCWLFAVKFEMKVDLAQAATMAEHWADRQRFQSNVREPARLSKVLIDKARPVVLEEFATEAERIRVESERVLSEAGRSIAKMLEDLKIEIASKGAKGPFAVAAATPMLISSQPLASGSRLRGRTKWDG